MIVGLSTNYTVSNLTDGGTYYFALTAVSTEGLESGYSNEVVYASSNPAQAALTVNKQGSGTGTVSGTGISCGSDCSEVLTPGAIVSLRAGPDGSSVFAGWAGACTGTTTNCTVTVNGNTSVAATFYLRTYSITATAGANGSISPTGTTTVTHGGSQVYTINPAPGFQVVEVRVDGTSVGALTSYTFKTITAAHTIAATFEKKTETHTLIVSREGSGNGIMVANPPGLSFSPGTVVVLTASPDSNSDFTGWSGACIGNDPTCTITINADSSVTASFNSKVGSVFKLYLPLIRKGVSQTGKLLRIPRIEILRHFAFLPIFPLDQFFSLFYSLTFWNRRPWPLWIALSLLLASSTAQAQIPETPSEIPAERNRGRSF